MRYCSCLLYTSFAEKNKDTIVIADEIGNGIVPLDAFEREYREQTGRAETVSYTHLDVYKRQLFTCHRKYYDYPFAAGNGKA